MKNTARGFSLVELLVVIAIIAILTTIGLTLFSSVQKQARISKRISDLNAIRSALELYYSTEKKYPTIGATMTWRSECTNPGDVIPGLVPKYMPTFPSDPSMNLSTCRSIYRYNSNTDGTDYKLLDWRIDEFTQADYLSQKNLIDPNDDGGTPGNCYKIETTAGTISAWAIYSNNTGVALSSNPACW